MRGVKFGWTRWLVIPFVIGDLEQDDLTRSVEQFTRLDVGRSRRRCVDAIAL